MTDRALLFDALLTDPSRAAMVPRDEARSLLIEMARVERALELHVLSPPAPTPPGMTAPAEAPGDRLLDMREAAARLALTKRELYRRVARLPFVVRLGRRLRFSERGLARYLEDRLTRREART